MVGDDYIPWPPPEGCGSRRCGVGALMRRLVAATSELSQQQFRVIGRVLNDQHAQGLRHDHDLPPPTHFYASTLRVVCNPPFEPDQQADYSSELWPPVM